MNKLIDDGKSEIGILYLAIGDIFILIAYKWLDNY